MYERLLGFDRSPFSQAPELDFLHWTEQHAHARKALEASVRQQLALFVLLGASGVGKTTLIRRLVEAAPQDVAVGCLASAADDGVSAAAILAAFGIDSDASRPETDWRGLEAFLTERRNSGGRVLLFVDRAEQAPDAAFDTLHRLADLKSGEAPLLTQALVGHPRLRARLSQPQFRGFVERPGVTFQFNPMSMEDTAAYIRRRLEAAGGVADIFDAEALQGIHARTEGVPRKINSLCDLCLAEAHRSGARRVDSTLADAVIAKTRAPARASANGNSRVAHLSQIRGAQHVPAAAREDDTVEVAARFLSSYTNTDDHVLAFSDETSPPPKTSSEHPADNSDAARLSSGVPGRATPSGFKSMPRHSSWNPSSGPQDAQEPADDPTDDPAGRRGLPPWAAALGGLVAAAVLVVVLMAAPERDGLWPGLAALTSPVELSPAANPDEAVGKAAEARASDVEFVAVAEFAPPDPEGADALFRQALDISIDDPAAAALGFARAAIRGHTRAAYYLGQMYETGDGVPYDLALARAWYEKAGDGIPGARLRKNELPPSSAMTSDEAPVPVFSARSISGAAELVWSGSPGGRPAGYVVELAEDPGAGRRITRQVATSAVWLAIPAYEAVWWRVASGAPGEAEPASEWRRVASAK